MHSNGLDRAWRTGLSSLRNPGFRSHLGRKLGVMEATERRPGFGVEWDAAAELAEALTRGASLPLLSSTVLLDPGEVLHADVNAHGWRFHSVDVSYASPRVMAFGGVLTTGITAVASAAARRRAREEAARFAAPQWRALGLLRILATDQRLLVLHEGSWASVWFPAIRQMRPALDELRLELVFEDDPPYALAGPWMPYLSVVLATALTNRVGVDAVVAALAR